MDDLIGKITQGDCLQLMKKMPDKSIDLVLTDPPYGIGENNKKNLSRGKLAETTNYGDYGWDNKRIGIEYFSEMLRVSKHQIIFGGNYYVDYLRPSASWIQVESATQGQLVSIAETVVSEAKKDVLWKL